MVDTLVTYNLVCFYFVVNYYNIKTYDPEWERRDVLKIEDIIGFYFPALGRHYCSYIFKGAKMFFH